MTAEALAFAAACAAAASVGALGGTRASRPGGRRSERGHRVLGRLARFVPSGAGLAELDGRLIAAGRPGGLGPREFLAAKAALAMAAAGATLTVAAALPGRLGVVAAAAGPVAGFLAPDAWLARRRRARVAELRRDLPALLDLLAISAEAGLALAQALAEVGRRSRAPLARLWEAVAAEVAVGVPLERALERHRREVAIEEIDAFAHAVTRAARHGAPLSDTLAAQAREARHARRRRIADHAARAGPKMQLVVALLLVPSVMLLVAAALVSALAGGGAGALAGGF